MSKIEIKTIEELNQLIATNPKVVVKSGYISLKPNTPSGCIWCDIVKPICENLANIHTDVVFAEINVKRGNLLNVPKIPYFHLYQDGVLIAEEMPKGERIGDKLTISETNVRKMLAPLIGETQVAQTETPAQVPVAQEKSINSKLIDRATATMYWNMFSRAVDLSDSNSTTSIAAGFLYRELPLLCEKYKANLQENKAHPFTLINADEYEIKESLNNIIIAIFLSEGGVTDETKTTLYQAGEYARVTKGQKLSGRVLLKTIIKKFE
jgi:hypothetical protein